MIRFLLPLAVVAVAGAGAAVAATASMHSSGATVRAVKTSDYGMVLVGANGRTLYRYTPDRKGASVCAGKCAAFWPPLLVAGKAKPTVGAGAKAALVGIVKRANGARQVSYAGFPLYYFAGDKKAGDVKGEGFGSKWYVVDTRGALVRHPLVSAPAPTTTTTPTTTSSGGGYGGGGYTG